MKIGKALYCNLCHLPIGSQSHKSFTTKKDGHHVRVDYHDRFHGDCWTKQCNIILESYIEERKVDNEKKS